MPDIFEPEPEEILEPESEPVISEVPEVQPEPEPEITPDEVAGFLWDLTKKFEDEDEEAHRNFFNQAVLGEFYWNNRQHIYKDFLDSGNLEAYKYEDDDESDLYTANIYRPNGESIIAAMAIDLPQVNFYPDDADVADDVTTANAYARIAGLIQKHNKAHTLITRALQILYNQSFVAFYNYNRESPKYGTYKKPRFEEVSQTKTVPVCPNCNAKVLDDTPPITCETCGYVFEQPAASQETETFPTIVGYTDEPKTREVIHAFGPLHVKCGPYIQTQDDTPYVILKFERHPAIGKYQFNKFKDEIGKNRAYTATSEYERQYRAELYKGEYDHLDTWVCVWLRPAVYETIEDNDKLYQHLVTNYPKGIAVTFINGVMVDSRDEDLDDHWTICENPLGTFINSEPIGKACIPVQDATNELVNLSMDTIKHGIPQTFISSDLINFNAYKQMEVKPGMAIPANSLPAGRSINDMMATTRTATLSQEVDNVYNKLTQLSQLTTGAFPSIYGGVVQGSRTASEYAQSRAQALQRLSLTWNMLKQVWADVMAKACVSFANNMRDDERDVTKDGSSFINNWIRRAELTGKIGKVEPEPDEQLPTSWAQQRDVIMRLIEMNSPMINELLMQPTNAYTVKNAMGFREIEIPGYKDRIKQLMEIDELLKSQPIGESPSVQIDFDLDDHVTEAQVCRDFLVSEQGLMLKNTSPAAYHNVYLHFMQHRQVTQMLAAQQQPMQQEPENA